MKTVIVMLFAAAAALHSLGGSPETQTARKLLIADESRGALRYYDTSDPAKCFSMPAIKPVLDLKPVGGRKYRTVGGSGFQVFDLDQRKLVDSFSDPRLRGVMTVCDLPDGGFIGGVNVGRYPGHRVDFVRFNAKREYVTTYQCKQIYNIRIAEWDRDGKTLLAAWEKGFSRVKFPEEGTECTVLTQFLHPKGHTAVNCKPALDGINYLCACGFQGGLRRVSPEGKLLSSMFMPTSADRQEFYYGGFEEMPDGSVYVAHWIGHGAEDSRKGWQVFQFASDGSLRWGLYDPDHLGSVIDVHVIDAPELHPPKK